MRSIVNRFKGRFFREGEGRPNRSLSSRWASSACLRSLASRPTSQFYSCALGQLRRATDAAAIAAAGQMRQDRTIATVGLTARQFIEFHGLDPTDVFVETCQNQPREDTVAFDPSDPGNTQGIQLGTGIEEDTEICTGDQRKLVRVTARVESPTFFPAIAGHRLDPASGVGHLRNCCA